MYEMFLNFSTDYGVLEYCSVLADSVDPDEIPHNVASIVNVSDQHTIRTLN